MGKENENWLNDNIPEFSQCKNRITPNHTDVKKAKNYFTLHHKIANVLSNRKTLSEAERCVFMTLWQEIWGWNNEADSFSFQQLSDWTGIEKRNVIIACKSLEKRNMILYFPNEKGIKAEYKNPRVKDSYSGSRMNIFIINKFYKLYRLGKGFVLYDDFFIGIQTYSIPVCTFKYICPHAEKSICPFKGDACVTNKGDACVTLRNRKGDACVTNKGDACVTLKDVYTLFKKKRERNKDTHTYVCKFFLDFFSSKDEKEKDPPEPKSHEKRNGQKSPLVTSAVDDIKMLGKVQQSFEELSALYPPKRVRRVSDLRLWEDMFYRSNSENFYQVLDRKLYSEIKQGIENYVAEEKPASVSWFSAWLKNHTWKNYQEKQEEGSIWPTLSLT